MNLDPAEIAALLPFEGRYELRRRRWLDGPHESWEAFDRVLEREVVVNRAYRSADASRFIRTAKVASALRHPNLLPVYDLGILGGDIPYFTTPSVPARPLDDLLRQVEREPGSEGVPFPLGPLVAAVRDACRAVEHAHRHGFLHLGLLPGSLLVGEGFGEVLLDGGWEEAAARGDERDGESYFDCRPTYMSPEQIDGRRAGVGPAADVFGLGGILHVILFGTPPNHLPGMTGGLEVIKAVAGRRFDPRRPGTLRPLIRTRRDRTMAHGLVPICLKSLAYEPGDRYPSAAALGADLDEWQHRSRSAWPPWLWRW
jgi:serine/threonine protein kinase